jgi:hypothetical protein
MSPSSHFRNPYPAYAADDDQTSTYSDAAVRADIDRLIAELLANGDGNSDNHSGRFYAGPAGVAFAPWYAA